MKAIILLLSLSISLLFLSSCGKKVNPKDDPFTRINSVKLGMTKEEVYNIMEGIPRHVREVTEDGKVKIYVRFPVDPIFSTTPGCVIDKETNQVERVTYNENDYVIKGIKETRRE